MVDDRFLAVQQVQAPQFPVHISYFLQNCKKRQLPEKGFALNMTPKGIMIKITATPKDTETQHLKLSDAVYRDFFITLLG